MESKAQLEEIDIKNYVSYSFNDIKHTKMF